MFVSKLVFFHWTMGVCLKKLRVCRAVWSYFVFHLILNTKSIESFLYTLNSIYVYVYFHSMLYVSLSLLSLVLLYLIYFQTLFVIRCVCVCVWFDLKDSLKRSPSSDWKRVESTAPHSTFSIGYSLYILFYLFIFFSFSRSLCLPSLGLFLPLPQ